MQVPYCVDLHCILPASLDLQAAGHQERWWQVHWDPQQVKSRLHTLIFNCFRILNLVYHF